MKGMHAIQHHGTRPARTASRAIFLTESSARHVAPDPEDLLQLISAIAREQDRNAFARLFAYFAPRIKGFLGRAGLADAVAEELTQETMVAVWRKAPSFDPSRAGLSTWVFTIARNLRIDHLRRSRIVPGDEPFEPDDEADPAPSGENIAIATEREETIRQALANLSDEQAKIVRLSFFAEKPHAEIARELDIPLGTVKSRIRLALARLRLVLDSDT